MLLFVKFISTIISCGIQHNLFYYIRGVTYATVLLYGAAYKVAQSKSWGGIIGRLSSRKFPGHCLLLKTNAWYSDAPGIIETTLTSHSLRYTFVPI